MPPKTALEPLEQSGEIAKGISPDSLEFIA